MTKKRLLQRIKNYYHLALSLLWIARQGYPARRLTVVGITGTDGKTTTCNLLYEILRKAGYKAAMLSTVSAKIGDEEIDTGLHVTNPDARQLQPLLSTMVKRGVTHLVLEVTAHGIDQYRVLGCNFSIGVLTNISHEHLDDFETIEKYRAVKAKLFSQVKWAVLNKDDDSYTYIVSRIDKSRTKVMPYGPLRLRKISDSLQGEYNAYNLGAAAAVASLLGVPTKFVTEVAATFAGVAGRREEVKAGQKYRVLVDFAHTPNALSNILIQLRRELPAGKKLIVAFGATGQRDRTKRPIMGKVAAEIADMVVITSDDARSEDPNRIYAEIAAGIPAELMYKVTQENDRRKAIRMVVGKAGSGDIVLLAGKGHEKSLAIGGKEIPWSDMEEAKRAIAGIR